MNPYTLNPLGLCDSLGLKLIVQTTKVEMWCVTAWGQGVRKRPISGGALRALRIWGRVSSPDTNPIRRLHQQGLDGLPYDLHGHKYARLRGRP